MRCQVLLTLLSMVGMIEAGKTCLNLPPGLSKMIKGVDVSKLDLLPLEVVGEDGIMSPVLPLTCLKNKQWQSAKGKVYDLPDQIWQISTTPGGYMSSSVSTHTSYDEVRDSMGANVQLGGEFGPVAFSLSTSYKKMQSSITNSSRFVSEVTAFSGAIQVDFNPPEELTCDKYANSYIENTLPASFDSDPASYYSFIELYGTHYFATANFGGFVKMLCETKTEYFATTSESEIEVNAKAAYFDVLNVQVGVSKGKSTVNENYKSNTKTSIKYYGGDTNVLSTQGFEKWQPTVENDPWLFSGKLKPISDLIKNATKQASMKRAVKFYLLKNFLKEQDSILNGARAKFDNPVLGRITKNLNRILYSQTPDEGAVMRVAQEVANYTTVPVWFLNTTLCMSWKATKDAGQCAAKGLPAQLCAPVNSMTPSYYDNTDNRDGGCKMQWGLVTKAKYPTWFDMVRICYQFYAEGNKLQCGNDAGKTYCANINNFTTEYFDDTGSRKGGCRMRWMLETPEYSMILPHWMNVVQLCFKWEGDGDLTQCGGGAPASECVLPNMWSTYYLDYTDQRKGGCKMSWGLKTAF